MNGVAHYQSCFNNLVGTDELLSLRQKAIEHFADAGFPTTKDEEWAFTNIAPLTRINFELAASSHPHLLLSTTTATASTGWSLSMATLPPRILISTACPPVCASSAWATPSPQTAT